MMHIRFKIYWLVLCLYCFCMAKGQSVRASCNECCHVEVTSVYSHSICMFGMQLFAVHNSIQISI